MRNAETMSVGGKQYHIGLGPDDVSERILMAGDEARIKKLENFLDDIRVRRKNREFYTVTGKYKGKEITAIATGIGVDNVEIVLIELARALGGRKATVIRIGSSGSIQENVKIGDLVITSASVRLENTSLFYVPEGFPAVASWEVVAKLKEVCERLGYRYHIGLTATAPSFYAAQQRDMSDLGLFPRVKVMEELSSLKVLNFEMESSTLFILSHLLGFKAGTVCAVFAERKGGRGISDEEKAEAERRVINVGLEAIVEL